MSKLPPIVHRILDRNGEVVGSIVATGDGLYEARDRDGNLKGIYDTKRNETRNKNGHRVGMGNLLSNLLYSA
jgi:hypothetical protein